MRQVVVGLQRQRPPVALGGLGRAPAALIDVAQIGPGHGVVGLQLQDLAVHGRRAFQLPGAGEIDGEVEVVPRVLRHVGELRQQGERLVVPAGLNSQVGDAVGDDAGLGLTAQHLFVEALGGGVVVPVARDVAQLQQRVRVARLQRQHPPEAGDRVVQPAQAQVRHCQVIVRAGLVRRLGGGVGPERQGCAVRRQAQLQQDGLAEKEKDQPGGARPGAPPAPPIALRRSVRRPGQAGDQHSEENGRHVDPVLHQRIGDGDDAGRGRTGQRVHDAGQRHQSAAAAPRPDQAGQRGSPERQACQEA